MDGVLQTDSTSCPVAPADQITPRAGVTGALARHPFLVAIVLALLTTAVYVFGVHYTTGSDTIPNELLPIVMLNGQGFDFTELQPHSAPLPYYFKIIKGRVVSFYPIIPGLLNVPVYAIAKWRGVNIHQTFLLSGITCAWISGLSVGFMYLLLSRACRSVWTAIAFALIYAFATEVWSVTSRCLWQHGPSLLFLTGAIALLMWKNKRWMPFAGFLLGMAVWNRPTNIAFALPIAIYMIVHHRDRLRPFFAWAAIPAVGLALYSQIYWGSVFALGQGHRVTGGVVYTSVTNFNGPMLEGLAGLLFSPARGLFIFGPMFIFSFIYLPFAIFSRRVPPLYRYLAIGVLAYVLIFSKWSIWWGGGSFGYRMLIELLPALVLFGAAAWEGGIVRGWVLRCVYANMVAVSLYVNFLGAFYYPSHFNDVPDSIDINTSRLWFWRDTEITRCHALFMKDLNAWIDRKNQPPK